jgi:hypothetical protein
MAAPGRAQESQGKIVLLYRKPLRSAGGFAILALSHLVTPKHTIYETITPVVIQRDPAGRIAG